jgi:malate dehydrogenase (oxaloacetate-decarboxylating)
VVIHGAGTAGLGIADMMRDVMIREGLSHEEATRRFWALGSRGLLVDDNPRLRDFQVPYARPAAEVAGWSSDGRGVGLADVVAKVHPTMLIGTSTQAGAFTEPSSATWPRTPAGRSSCRCRTRPRSRGAARGRAHLDRRQP